MSVTHDHGRLVLLAPSLGSRPGAEEPVPQREALREVDVGPYVVALVVLGAQLHLYGRVGRRRQRARAWVGVDVSYDWCLGTPGPLPLSVRSVPDQGGRGHARRGAARRVRGAGR